MVYNIYLNILLCQVSEKIDIMQRKMLTSQKKRKDETYSQGKIFTEVNLEFDT